MHTYEVRALSVYHYSLLEPLKFSIRSYAYRGNNKRPREVAQHAIRIFPKASVGVSTLFDRFHFIPQHGHFGTRFYFRLLSCKSPALLYSRLLPAAAAFINPGPGFIRSRARRLANYLDSLLKISQSRARVF